VEGEGGRGNSGGQEKGGKGHGGRGREREKRGRMEGVKRGGKLEQGRRLAKAGSVKMAIVGCIASGLTSDVLLCHLLAPPGE